jgi:hypothetical protein
MATIKELEDLKTKVQAAKEAKARAAGALEQVLGRLKAEHGCNSVEEAERKLRQLQDLAHEAEADFNKSLDAFKEKHKEFLPH